MKKENNNGVLTIFLEGEIDAQNASAVQNEIDEIVDAEEFTSLVFDAENLSYISSAGLRLILTAQKKIKSQIRVKKPQAGVLDIFIMAGFHNLMDIEGA